VTYTRNGSFTVTPDRRVVDTIGSTLQLLPVDANGNVTANDLASAIDFVLPANKPADPSVALVNASIGIDGLVTVTYADGSDEVLGKVAMASFTAQEGLRPVGDGHWQSTGDSGPPSIDAATNGPLGTVRSGARTSMSPRNSLR
jgi:flagellar hook protein FlgE